MKGINNILIVLKSFLAEKDNVIKAADMIVWKLNTFLEDGSKNKENLLSYYLILSIIGV